MNYNNFVPYYIPQATRQRGLSSLFKKSTGLTYSEYLRSIRIRFAVTLFDSGLELVKNVSLLSGFSDPLYFSAVFKKSVGVSPKEYIKGK